MLIKHCQKKQKPINTFSNELLRPLKFLVSQYLFSSDIVLKFRAIRLFCNHLFLNDSILKLTCRLINHCHFVCIKIKSISMHPLLWMNIMLLSICMVFVELQATGNKRKIKMKLCASAGNRTSDPLLSSFPARRT